MISRAEAVLNSELLLNRILDKYGELMRLRMNPDLLIRFDALTPAARRGLIERQLNKETS